MSDQKNNTEPKTIDSYYFGGLKEYSLEQIEAEVLSESTYLDVFAGSDLRLKENVKTFSSTLASINKLDAISFQWNSEIQNHLTDDSKTGQVGLIAQHVAEVFPDLVRKDEATGYLTVNYGRLTTHLMVAIKELSTKIEEQNKKIEQLEEKIKI